MTLVGWLWIIFAAAFLLAGLIVLFRALFADRSRGHRRCPKCWYDMSGATSLRCSECGREPKSDRRLYRTRRHWLAAILGVVLMLASLGSYYGGEIHRDGWVAATPTVVHIALIPHQSTNTSLTELQSRLEAGALRQWQTWLLVQRSARLLDATDDSTTLIGLIRLLTRVENLGRNGSQTRPWHSWWSASDLAGERVVKALARLFRHSDDNVRTEAIRAVGQFTYRAGCVFPSLLSLLADSNQAIIQQAHSSLGLLDHRLYGPDSTLCFPWRPRVVRPGQRPQELAPDERRLYEALGNTGDNLAAAVQIFLEGTTDANPLVRDLSLYGLALLAPRDQMTRTVILAGCEDDDQWVRRTAIGATCILAFDKEVQNILWQSIENPDEHFNVTGVAIRALGLRKHEARKFIPLLRQVMSVATDYPSELARCYQAIGGDSEDAIDFLLDRLDSEPLHRPLLNGRSEILDALGRLHVESPRACRAVEPLLKHEHAEIKSAAACAYVHLGGQDLDRATKAIFEAMYAAKQNGSASSRWFWFAEYGRVSVPVLMDLLNRDEMAHRANAARFLGESWHAGIPALEKLNEMWDDPDPKVRPWVAEAIERIEWARDHPDWRPAQWNRR